MKRNSGNVLLVFILLLAFAALLVALLSLFSTGIKGVAQDQDLMQALYVAEAGLNKALWYLNTPTAEGGHGSTWRTSGITEAFGPGEYLIKVEDESGNRILVTSRGTVGLVPRTVKQIMQQTGMPDAFDYAAFCGSGTLTIKGSSQIFGSIYNHGDISIQSPASVTSGFVYTAEGYSVSGNGTYTLGTEEVSPVMPSLEPTYYNTRIDFAKTDPSALQGDQTFENYNLNGGAIYVNGNVTLKGTITGPGTIVVADGIKLDNATLGEGITLICEDQLHCAGSSIVQAESILYSSTEVKIAGDSRVTGSVVTEGTALFDGNVTVMGIVFAVGTGAHVKSIDINGTPNIYGSVVGSTFDQLTGNIKITYDASYLPEVLPPGIIAPGFGGDRVIPVTGTWLEE